MHNFLSYIFKKPDKYVLVWAFILANIKSNSCELDKRFIMSRFKLNRTTFNRIIDFGNSYVGGQKVVAKCSRNILMVRISSVSAEQKVNIISSVENPIITEIISFLNVILKRNGKRGIKENNKSASTYINKRLKDGHSTDDFKDVMLAQEKWLHDPKMHMYYRPSTLFSGKFEEYLNNIIQPNEQPKNSKQQDQLFNALRQAESDSNQEF